MRTEPVTEHQTFKQRVGSQPVCSVNTGARRFSYGKKSGEGRATVAVSPDTTASEMLPRSHRDRRHERIDTSSPATGDDVRKMIEQLVFTEMPRIEEEMVDTLFGHEDRHAFRHDIARCKVGERMTADHHPLTCCVDKERSFTAHRLRHEKLLTFGSGSGP